MLPDYPKLKKEIRAVLVIFYRKRVEKHAIALGQLPKTRLFEGKGSVIRRATGEEDKTPFMSSETGFELKLDEVPTMNIDAILSKVNKAALEMAKSIESSFFSSISKQLDDAGRNIKHKGEVRGKDLLNALRNVFVPFDKSGNALQQLFYTPDLENQMRAAIKEVKDNPELKKEREEILMTKWEEWRAEEASRKLVG